MLVFMLVLVLVSCVLNLRDSIRLVVVMLMLMRRNQNG